MRDEQDEEIAVHLERAQSSMRAARTLVWSGYSDYAARAYHAAFYAATALLVKEGLTFGKHSGVVAAIHHHFVKTGRLDVKHGRNPNWLFGLRTTGNFGGATHVSTQDAEAAIDAAQEICEAVRQLIYGQA